MVAGMVGKSPYTSNRFWGRGAPGGTERRVKKEVSPSHQPGPGDSRVEGLPEHLPVALPRALHGVRAGAPCALTHLGSPLSLSFLSCKMGMKAASSSWGGCPHRIKGASASEGHPADAGSAHSCELMPLLLSPQDCDRRGTQAHFTNGVNGCYVSCLLTCLWARRLHIRPHIPFTSALLGRCCSGPLSTGGGCASGKSSALGITQPAGAETQSMAFCPQGPGWATTPDPTLTRTLNHSTDEKVADTRGCPPSSPPLLPSLTEPWVCSAATGSGLVGLPSPEEKPSLAAHPPSPEIVLGVRVPPRPGH